ncbi:hypothetical protein [Absidia glauca]|uniref:GTP-binding protein n=1 Tax=Absidia glauca TaxID=4829 RepID=A0A168REX0_ABSGL|nr:hypothetical protein [Absidia glauca]
MEFDYSHPSEYDTGDVIDDHYGSDKPRILLMGLQRSGKSSIQRVVFGKMPPNDTLYLESTTKIQREDITRSFIDFQIWDFPGQINFFDPAYDSLDIFESVGALIFVIDAQDDYSDALSRLFYTVTSAYKVNPNITFEVLLHKVDGLSDDYKIGMYTLLQTTIEPAINTCHLDLDTQRDVQQRMSDALQDAECDHIHLTYYLTSIYDHSIYEAFSKIIQKLIRELPTLENLLNVLCSNSGIDKAYLFDTLTKIYIATDSSPVDMQSYELCSDMIDVVIDIECIYGIADRTQNSTPNGDYNGERKDKGDLVQSPLSEDLDTRKMGNPGDNDDSALLGASDNQGGIQQTYSNGDQMDGQDSTTLNNGGQSQQEPAAENEASSLIKLDNGDVLYMREVNRLLVLICLLRQDNFEKHGLIDYNFQCFKEAVTEVFEFSQKRNTQQQQRNETQLQVTETQQSQDTSPPFTYHEEDNSLTDKMGEKLVLFKHITAVFTMIQSFPDTKIGIASRTGTPDWARLAIDLFKVDDTTTLQDTIDYMEIYPGRKTQHLTELAQSSGISFEDMLFFDDERRNSEVKSLGVHFVLVDPAKGVTMHQFKAALQQFERQAKMVQTTLSF